MEENTSWEKWIYISVLIEKRKREKRKIRLFCFLEIIENYENDFIVDRKHLFCSFFLTFTS